MEHPVVLAVGSSAGGLPALIELVAALPPDLPAYVLVTVHTPEHAPSRLPQILTRAGQLPAHHAEQGARALVGRIYVAPPGQHLLVADGHVQLSNGPRVGRHRPAVDVMFASAAREVRGRMVAVVLSGALDDGAVGAALVARAGGHVIVQEPVRAAFGSMPRAALAAAPGAVAVPTARLGEQATALIRVLARDHSDSPVHLAADGGRSVGPPADPFSPVDDGAVPTRLVCPECGGSLGRIDLPQISYFRCHVGHQYGPRALEAAQVEAAEGKLWMAIAALEEHAAWARHLGEQDGTDIEAPGYRAAAQHSADLAALVRAQVRRGDPEPV